MEKLINIDGKQVPFKATAATPRAYRMLFNRDLFEDFSKIEKRMKSKDPMTSEALYLFEDIAYTMAKQADPDIAPTPDEWLDGFSMMPFYDILPELVDLWRMSNNSTSQSKKK